MASPNYYTKREDELKNHHCAYRDSYAYKSTLVDKKDRQLNACDARWKHAATLCPRFKAAKPFELPQPNGWCIIDDGKACQMQCGKPGAHVIEMNGDKEKLVFE